MKSYRLGLGLLGLSLLTLLAGCNTSHPPTGITDVNLSRDKAGKDVTTTFKPRDHAIYALGSINAGGNGVKMKAVWTQVNAGGVKDKVLITNDFTLEGNVNVFDGYISRETDWPRGTYKTDFYFDGRLNKTIEWTVK